MATKVQYQGADTSSGPSPSIWGTCRWLDFLLDAREGIAVMDDFTDFYASGSKYTLLEADAAASIGLIATADCGVLRLAPTTTDNEECNLQGGINEGVLGDFATGVRMWFEARVRVSAVTDDVCGIMFGLAEEGCCGANLQTDDTAAIADKDYLVFRTLQADGDGLDIEYKTSGVTAVVHKELAGTLVAATWIKAGWYFDGTNIKFYVNGSKVGDNLLITATGFPDGEEMHFVAGAKVGSAATLNFDIDWWRYARERD